MTRTCVSPKKAVRTMREFANAVSTLTCYDDDNTIIKMPIVFRKDKEGFATKVLWNISMKRLNPAIIYYNLDSLNNKPMKIFRYYWSEVCPMFKGFASVTLALLHELGHLYVQEDVIANGYTYEERIQRINEIRESNNTLMDLNSEYYLLPDEMSATLWAIEWLQDSKNRKLAKAFEKEFFKCFE